ncbi:PAS domain-containing protein [Natrarchaeobaculum sulfurireducens]|uniref:histidine kinase n=1 Tax=Natrarchaeobaculum sulfurireducens TaxID=2044521 RepID=A0A346PKA9_9EURY|nr:PAS domain-containing protein [Natrarchaeobaculum sulfurireducens]AXR79954.1 Signal transduction histidine kinase [Natrarchaeobaculum sulfurireducens]
MKSVTVLHLDDDRSTLDLTAEFFDSEWPEAKVVTETQPTTAVEFAETNQIDCVISDFNMPELNGLEFFEQLHDAGVNIPFVLYTGKGSEEIASRALNAGVTAYFQKGGPDQLRRLINRVKQASTEYQNKIVADRYSTVLDALGYPIYVVDETGVFNFVNEELADLTQYETDEIIGQPTDLIKSDVEVENAKQHLSEILSADGPDTIHFDVEIQQRSGETVLCRDHMGVLPYQGESFRGSVGILRDITDEREQEHQLTYRTKAIDKAPIGIAVCDPNREDLPMIYVNEEFERMTGYSSDEVVGHNCRLLQGSDTDEAAIETLRQGIEATEQTTVVIKNYRKDGEPFWNRVSIAPVRDKSGTLTEWIGFQQDVTAQRNYQLQIERRNEQLEMLTQIVSHDLRNPLNVASSYLELAGNDLSDTHYQPIEDSLCRIDAIIEDLLVMVSSGQIVSDVKTVRLADLADQCWMTVETNAASLNVQTTRIINADEQKLKLLIENLFRNAVEHGGDDVTVTVGDLEDGFYVADNGPGIPADERENIFELGHTSQEGGTGLGLNIVTQLAEAHDWNVSVSNSETGGARFEFTGVDVVDLEA